MSYRFQTSTSKPRVRFVRQLAVRQLVHQLTFAHAAIEVMESSSRDPEVISSSPLGPQTDYRQNMSDLFNAARAQVGGIDQILPEESDSMQKKAESLFLPFSSASPSFPDLTHTTARLMEDSDHLVGEAHQNVSSVRQTIGERDFVREGYSVMTSGAKAMDSAASIETQGKFTTLFRSCVSSIEDMKLLQNSPTSVATIRLKNIIRKVVQQSFHKYGTFLRHDPNSSTTMFDTEKSNGGNPMAKEMAIMFERIAQEFLSEKMKIVEDIIVDQLSAAVEFTLAEAQRSSTKADSLSTATATATTTRGVSNPLAEGEGEERSSSEEEVVDALVKRADVLWDNFESGVSHMIGEGLGMLWSLTGYHRSTSVDSSRSSKEPQVVSGELTPSDGPDDSSDEY